MTNVNVAAAPQRKVGFLLGVGIFLLPIVFVWFLLRKGHSTLSRVIGFAWLVVSLLVFAFSDRAPSSEASNTPTAEAAAEAPPAHVGDTLATTGASVKITTVKTVRSVGGPYMREAASDGGILVVVNYSLTNTGEKPLASYERPDIKLMDGAGTVYGPDLGKSGAYATEANLNTKIMSDLNPGITTQGAEVFEVGETRFDPATWRIVVGDKKHLVAIQ